MRRTIQSGVVCLPLSWTWTELVLGPSRIMFSLSGVGYRLPLYVVMNQVSRCCTVSARRYYSKVPAGASIM